MSNNGFKPGAPGRPKGALNKRTREAQAILEDAGFCPITAMIDMYKTAIERFAEEIQKEDSGRGSGFIESDAPRYLKIASDAAKDLASYSYPKLKAIERISSNPLDGMSPEQRLEAMKQAVAFLESDIKKGAE